jgi:hypothetical protein
MYTDEQVLVTHMALVVMIVGVIDSVSEMAQVTVQPIELLHD